MISNRIRELVKEKGLTLKELAEKIGYTDPGFRQSLYKNDFKISTLQKIADALSVNIFELFGDLYYTREYEDVLKSEIRNVFIKEEDRYYNKCDSRLRKYIDGEISIEDMEQSEYKPYHDLLLYFHRIRNQIFEILKKYKIITKI